MEKKKIILPTKRFFKAEEEDLDLRLNLDSSENLMRLGDRDIVLDIAQLFSDERNDSKNYKLYGKLKMVFRNMYSGSTTYEPLQKNLYLSGDGSDNKFGGFLAYNELAFLRNDVLREIYIPLSGTTPTFGTTTILTGTTNTGHTITTPITAPYKNWNIYVSYVHSHNTQFQMKYSLSGTSAGETISFTSGDGIPFRLSYSGGSYYELTSPVEHGMKAGEFVVLSGSTLTGNASGRTFTIDSIGNEVYNSDKYVINILKSQIVTGTIIPLLTVGKRCLNRNDITGTTSQYYVHQHKTLTTEGDYILDKIGFESPIWEDERKLLVENSSGDNDVLVERNRMESLIYDFKEPLVLTGITNNLGYTPTDVYLTVVYRNSNGFFNYPPKVGWKFNFHNTWIDKHFSGTTSNETSIGVTALTGNTGTTGFTAGLPLQIGTSGLTGAYVEYNKNELKERIISEAFHKITNPIATFDHNQDGNVDGFSGATSSNMFGLYYQPYYRIKLKELSPYVETAKTNDIINLPENTLYFEKEGLWKWRDLYDHGYIDPDGYGVNHPFINNIHYVKNDINFYLRNERFYQNKNDGLTNFNDKTITDC
jgi:hypothetical protein